MTGDKFAGLNFLIQYRSRRDGVTWANMAAFDVSGPAERYLAKQQDMDGPWEYQLVDLEAGTTVRQAEPESQP